MLRLLFMLFLTAPLLHTTVTKTHAANPLDSTSTADESFDDEELDFASEFEEEFSEGQEVKVSDPLRGYNRFMTKANDKFYFWSLKPTAKAYRIVVPQAMRISVNRFFNNLAFPIHFVNNVLQLKFKQAGVELARFGINTTFGFGGFEDLAKEEFGLNPYPEDFGQTLGRYGIGSGPHLVLPILGPSNLRDTIGLGADTLLDPICYLGICFADYWEAALGVRSYQTINYASLHIGEYESLKKDAVDLYIFLRDAYEQSRQKEIEE